MAQNGLDELAREPTEAEWQRAARARSYSAVLVRDDYEVADGVLRAVEGSSFEARRYMLAGATGLLKETYHLDAHDEASLVTFARRWGTLGYQNIITAADARQLGPLWDPLAWIWAHVSGIRTVLDLYGRLRRGDEDALEDYLEGLRRGPGPQQDKAKIEVGRLMRERRWAEAAELIPVLSRRPEPPDAYLSVHVICGERQHVAGFGLPTFWHKDIAPAETAWRIIVEVLNPNLAGSRTALWHDSDGDPWASPTAVLVFDSTLSAVYWHLKQLVTASRVAECVECGFPFVQVDGRQRFCPPTDVERQQGKRDSRCAMRWRKRQQRQGGQR